MQNDVNSFTSEAVHRYRRQGGGARSPGDLGQPGPECDASSRLSTSAARADSAGSRASSPAPAPARRRSTAGRIRKRIRDRLPTPQSVRTWPGAQGSGGPGRAAPAPALTYCLWATRSAENWRAGGRRPEAGGGRRAASPPRLGRRSPPGPGFARARPRRRQATSAGALLRARSSRSRAWRWSCFTA